MSTKLDIFNMALINIGNTELMTGVDDASNEGVVLRLLYDKVLDQVLRANRWDFARDTVYLTATDEVKTSRYSEAYFYPSDVVAIHSLEEADIRVEEDENGNDINVPYGCIKDSKFIDRPIEAQAFTTTTVGSRRVILTSIEHAIAHVTKRVTDEALFDELFCDCMAWCLASRIAVPLSANKDLIEYAKRMYFESLDVAKAAVLRESQDGQEPLSPVTNMRLT